MAKNAGEVLEVELTEAQRDLLLAIRRYIAKNSISPSYEQLAVLACISKSTVRTTLGRLVRKGYVRRAGGRYRSLVVTEKGRAA